MAPLAVSHDTDLTKYSS